MSWHTLAQPFCFVKVEGGTDYVREPFGCAKPSLRSAENRAYLKARQQPAALLCHKDERNPKLAFARLALVIHRLRIAARHDSRIAVHARLYVIPGEPLILQIARLETLNPLRLGQHEAARPDADKVVGQRALNERRIAV